MEHLKYSKHKARAIRQMNWGQSLLQPILHSSNHISSSLHLCPCYFSELTTSNSFANTVWTICRLDSFYTADCLPVTTVVLPFLLPFQRTPVPSSKKAYRFSMSHGLPEKASLPCGSLSTLKFCVTISVYSGVPCSSISSPILIQYYIHEWVQIQNDTKSKQL